ncbi:Hypothetical predicted protein, partial [Mytilus galloprovincialis]
MPRLYILSCIFHLQNSQCVQPLHLLCTDIADKFSNSSSTFLSINARLGAGISKDSLRRYITNRCRELEKKQRYIFSDSFIVASFDNLDKNQAYSVVCAGKDRSGFHGTTIQTVVPKPSQKINMFDDSNLISNLNHVNQTSIEHDISEVPNSRDRKLEKGIIQKLVNPDDKFGLPQVKKQNKFSDMSPSDLKETAAEISEWDEFYRSVTKQNYQRLIPYHLADLHTFPEPVIQHFTAGCFSVSISGKHLYSVALDEAHEMEINLKSKNALNSFSQSSLANLTFYLPYRAKTLHNLKSELQLEREEGLYQREGTMSYVKNAEKTVCEYMSNLETSSLFDINCNEHLHHIFTRTETDHEQTDSLINYRKSGEEDMANYLKCFLFRTYETAGKPPSRKRRNLKTFAPIKITIHKQKKEIKDQNTVISCLRKKIAFSKHSGNAVKDLDQFLQLPRALCDAEGIPEKGQKATAANVFKNIYSDAFFITAGGFDDDRKDRAISILKGQVVDYDLASGNHEEADTRVWLHASVTTADQVIIYSPDTDVFFIGLPLVSDLNKTVYVQLRDSPYNNSFLSMDKLVKCITLNDSLLQGIDSVLICMQLLFIYSGCDFVSYFRAIREKLWERVVTEVEMMPNHEALKLHWMRCCCWVFDYWSQSTSNTHALSDLSKCGWQITDNRLEIVWDTVLNFQKVEKTVEWYTKGCG